MLERSSSREAHFPQKLFNIASTADVDTIANNGLLLRIWVRLADISQVPEISQAKSIYTTYYNMDIITNLRLVNCVSQLGLTHNDTSNE